MPDLFDAITLTSLLIFFGVGTYVAGFLFRNQIYIRLLVALGSLSYAWYYWIAGPIPLWEAIIGTGLIFVASVQGIVQLWWSRMPSSVPQANRHIFQLLPELEPGLFNKLMRHGDQINVQTPMILTREGARPDALWLLVSGDLSLERSQHAAATLSKPGFVGELAWLLKDTASATVIAQPGAQIIRWSYDDLTRAMRGSHRLELALDAAIAVDIARKLAKSRPIEALNPDESADTVDVGQG